MAQDSTCTATKAPPPVLAASGLVDKSGELHTGYGPVKSFIPAYHDCFRDDTSSEGSGVRAAHMYRDRAFGDPGQEDVPWCDGDPFELPKSTTSDYANNIGALVAPGEMQCKVIHLKESSSPEDEAGLVTHVCKGLHSTTLEDECAMCTTLDDNSFSHTLRWMQRLLKVPVCGLILGEGEVVSVCCMSGVYKATRPVVGSLLDWLVSRRCTDTESIVVCDTWQDEDYRYDAQVCGNAGVRFYAARPVVMDGEVIGTVFILDRIVRELTENMRDGLEYFSLIFMHKLNEVEWKPTVPGYCRREMLEMAFDTSSCPLMIASMLSSDATLSLKVERVNTSFQKWFARGDCPGGVEYQGDVWDAWSFALNCKDRDAWDNLIRQSDDGSFEVGLKKGKMCFSRATGLLPESLPENMRECCRMLARCMRDDFGEQIIYYVVSLKDAAPLRLQRTSHGLEPSPVSYKGVPWLQDVSVGPFSHSSKTSRVYKCTFKGQMATVRISRFANAAIDARASAVMDDIMALPPHQNVLEKYRAGTIQKKRNTGYGYQLLHEHWLVQEYPDRGCLRDAVYDGLFPDEEKKPLFVALTLIDIAQGILHMWKEGVLYGEFSIKDVYLKSNPMDQLRGWKAVLGAPDIVTNCHAFDENIPRLYACSKQSSPETLLGSEVSDQSESFCLGMVLWEMWLESESWPQFDPQDLLQMLCFDDYSGLCISHDMPVHLARILSKCLGSRENSRLSILTILTLLQDYVQILTGRYHGRDGFEGELEHNESD